MARARPNSRSGPSHRRERDARAPVPSWRSPVQEPPTILILGDHDTRLQALSESIRSFGFRGIRAKTPSDAIDLAEQRAFRFRVALVDQSVAAPGLDQALSSLRAHLKVPEMVIIATGDAPEAERAQLLREAGVQLALWRPVSENALRFQINAALARANRHSHAAALRGDQRVPTNWTTRYYVAGRAKKGGVYSLSGGGAFLATPTPLMRGATLSLDLPLPGRPTQVTGEVIYNNVAGNLSRDQLPRGMGVRFVDTPASDHLAICDTVSESAVRYLV